MNKEKTEAEKLKKFPVYAFDNIPMINNNASAIENLIRIGEDFSLEPLKTHARKQASTVGSQQTNSTRIDCFFRFGNNAQSKVLHAFYFSFGKK